MPSAVLDEIFSNESDLETLRQSWKLLKKEKLNDDQIAESIAKVILKELGEDFIQSLDSEDTEK